MISGSSLLVTTTYRFTPASFGVWDEPLEFGDEIGRGDITTTLDTTIAEVELSVPATAVLAQDVSWKEAAESGLLELCKVVITITVDPLHATDLPMVLFSGEITAISFDDDRVKLMVSEHLWKLNREVPQQLYKMGCTNQYGDTRCTKRLGYTVNEIQYETGNSVRVAVAAAVFTPTQLMGGVVEFSDQFHDMNTISVLLYNRSWTIVGVQQTGSDYILSFDTPLHPFTILKGTLFRGCDKTKGACTEQNNSTRFLGFPKIPRQEVML